MLVLRHRTRASSSITSSYCFSTCAQTMQTARKTTAGRHTVGKTLFEFHSELCTASVLIIYLLQVVADLFWLRIARCIHKSSVVGTRSCEQSNIRAFQDYNSERTHSCFFEIIASTNILCPGLNMLHFMKPKIMSLQCDKDMIRIIHQIKPCAYRQSGKVASVLLKVYKLLLFRIRPTFRSHTSQRSILKRFVCICI